MEEVGAATSLAAVVVVDMVAEAELAAAAVVAMAAAGLHRQALAPRRQRTRA